MNVLYENIEAEVCWCKNVLRMFRVSNENLHQVCSCTEVLVMHFIPYISLLYYHNTKIYISSSICGSLPTEKEVVLVGTNNLDHDSPKDIAHGIFSIVNVAFEIRPSLKLILCGPLPRDLKVDSIGRHKISQVNKKLKIFCSGGNFKGLYFLKSGAQVLTIVNVTP